MLYVYLLASKPHGTLYVGVTSDLTKRVWEHKHKAEHDNPHWIDLYPGLSP